MRNKASNPLYELPKALQPTPLQLSTPHDSRINSLPWAGMRDRLILNPEYDLNEVLPELLQSAELHSTEVRATSQTCAQCSSLIPVVTCISHRTSSIPNIGKCQSNSANDIGTRSD
jgi:hypothetical protein